MEGAWVKFTGARVEGKPTAFTGKFDGHAVGGAARSMADKRGLLVGRVRTTALMGCSVKVERIA